jgi:hypothetical protein
MGFEELLLQMAKDWAADKNKSQTQTQCDQDHQLKPHIGLMGSPLGEV